MCYFRNMELLWASPRRRHTQAICCLRNVIFWYQLPARSRSTNRMQTKFRLKYVKIPVVLCLYFYSNHVFNSLVCFFIFHCFIGISSQSVVSWPVRTQSHLCQLLFSSSQNCSWVSLACWISDQIRSVLQWKQLQNTSLRS